MDDITKWNNNCETYTLFDILGKKWTIFIIFLIGRWYTKFNGILKVLTKLNPKVLAERLKQLEENNILRIELDENNGRNLYYLTEKGIKISENIAKLSSEHANLLVDNKKTSLD